MPMSSSLLLAAAVNNNSKHSTESVIPNPPPVPHSTIDSPPPPPPVPTPTAHSGHSVAIQLQPAARRSLSSKFTRRLDPKEELLNSIRDFANGGSLRKVCNGSILFNSICINRRFRSKQLYWVEFLEAISRIVQRSRLVSIYVNNDYSFKYLPYKSKF